MRRTAICAIALTALAAFGAACSLGNSTPTQTPQPTSTETPPLPTNTAAPTATATPALGPGVAIVVGGDLRVRSAPSTAGPVVRTLKDRTRVQIDGAADGENVLVGAQTWVSTIPDWTRLWFRLTDGTFVYASYIFIPEPAEESPLIDPHGEEKWIDVNVTTQTASAMIGARAIHVAPVSTGSPQFPSPLGTHHIESDGRIAVERMTASQAGYTPGQAVYDVENVLFTQYYDRNGDALHLNYWRPASVFGHTPTSHGCVGMLPHDAQWFWLFGAAGMRVEIHT
jgi:lipoprotein-anchoring transpeptidase ErfK/SrfK